MRAAAILFAFLLAAGVAGDVQGQSAEIDVMSAVASHIQPRLLGKVVIVSDQYRPTRRSEAENQVPIPGQVLRLLERSLSAEIKTRETVFECPGNTRDTCRLNFGADLLLTFSQPDVGADEARVMVEEQARSGSTSLPVSFLGRELILQRVDRVWTVTSDKVVIMS